MNFGADDGEDTPATPASAFFNRRRRTEPANLLWTVRSSRNYSTEWEQDTSMMTTRFERSALATSDMTNRAGNNIKGFMPQPSPTLLKKYGGRTRSVFNAENVAYLPTQPVKLFTRYNKGETQVAYDLRAGVSKM